MNSEFQAVLTDFGSAHRLTRNCADHEPKKVSNDPKESDHILQAESHDATHTITLTGAGFTLRWAAPEVLSEDEGGTESDMWSLGWVFYEVGYLVQPFQTLIFYPLGYDWRDPIRGCQEGLRGGSTHCGGQTSPHRDSYPDVPYPAIGLRH